MSKGFTLIELLVVCAIIVVITAIVLVDNSKFGGDVTLENFAYDVALSVRQAQIYGIAVNRFGTGCTGIGGANPNCFNAGYGMNFTLASPQQYTLFADLENNGVYDPNYLTSHSTESSVYPTGELVAQTTIQQGFSITGLCVIPSTAQGSCQPVHEIDILYIRPEPEAYISAGNSGSVSSCYQNTQLCNYEARVTLTSPKGDTRTVTIDATGQISVQLQ